MLTHPGVTGSHFSCSKPFNSLILWQRYMTIISHWLCKEYSILSLKCSNLLLIQQNFANILYTQCMWIWHTTVWSIMVIVQCEVMEYLRAYVRISWALTSTSLSICLTSSHHCCSLHCMVDIWNTSLSVIIFKHILQLIFENLHYYIYFL